MPIFAFGAETVPTPYRSVSRRLLGVDARVLKPSPTTAAGHPEGGTTSRARFAIELSLRAWMPILGVNRFGLNTRRGIQASPVPSTVPMK